MLKDLFGRHLTPGSFVVYGIRSGNSGGVRYGLVLKSDEDMDKTKWEQRVQVLTFERFSKADKISVSRPSVYNMIKVPENTFPNDIEETLITEWSKRLSKDN
jgi:hypothetical protein